MYACQLRARTCWCDWSDKKPSQKVFKSRKQFYSTQRWPIAITYTLLTKMCAILLLTFFRTSILLNKVSHYYLYSASNANSVLSNRVGTISFSLFVGNSYKERTAGLVTSNYPGLSSREGNSL